MKQEGNPGKAMKQPMFRTTMFLKDKVKKYEDEFLKSKGNFKTTR